MITILGPTATGKTRLAAELCASINGEVISADSRQVYRGMDIGTGKDLEDYVVDGISVPYHLVDIKEPGYEYNVYEFQKDFLNAYNEIRNKNKKVVLCGGTGMYLESVLLGYELFKVPINKELRNELNQNSDLELQELLTSLNKLHNTTDTTDRKRLIRAIEIADYYYKHPEKKRESFPAIPYHCFGIQLSREIIRERITARLKARLEEGMTKEIEKLLSKGIKPKQLMFYGLEYKYLTLYTTKQISYDEMVQKLNTAIHQFAKRQMTWFRRMEKRGVRINWLDGKLPNSQKLNKIKQIAGIK